MAIIYTYPIKTNPVDADKVLISDSEADNKTKQVTIASVRGATVSGVSQIVAGTNVTIDPVGGTGVVTVNSAGGGDTYTLQAEAKAGSSVPLKLDAATGTDSTVSLTEGANVTLTRNSATEITIAATGGSAGVSSFTNANGTYISAATENTSATGAVTTGIIDLSAIDGTSDATTRFLSKDNTWDVPSYTAAAGSAGQVQYNDGSNGFTASAGLTYSTGSSLNTLAVGAQGAVPGVLEVKGADTTVGRLRLYCPDLTTPHYFELMGPDHSGAATYSVQVPQASPGGTEKILSVSTWDSGTSKAKLGWVDLPTDTNTNIGNSNLTLTGNRSLSLGTYTFQVTGDTSFRLSNVTTDTAKIGLRVDNNIKCAGQAYTDLHDKGTTGGNVSIDWNDGNVQTIVMNANMSITQANCNPGGTYILIISQPAEQAYTITWAGDFDWLNNNTAPGVITGARTDVYTFVCRTATSLLGTYAEDFII